MQASGSYGQFCPVAMAAEIVCTRWTALVLREMFAGSTRFNDLRKGLPRMPGLPKIPAAETIRLGEGGLVEGLF